MEEYDFIVVGSGSGLDVASALANRGKEVAVVEKGPLGGTCLNRGCIPSKMLIHRADIVESIRESGKFGIESEVKNINFKDIVNEVNKEVEEDSKSIEKGIKSSDNHTLYKQEVEFEDNKVIKLNDKKITADKILIAAGSRPLIPPIEGLNDVNYLTSKEALELEEKPERLIIIGGGYISAELAHFFGEMGSDITIIEAGNTLVGNEDNEISEKLTEIYSDKYNVNLNLKASKVEEDGENIKVVAKDKEGNENEFNGDELLVAAGRIPNTDILDLEQTDIETNEKGFIETDDYLETSVDDVYALGDIADNFMFKHSANYEAEIVFKNIITGNEYKTDFSAMPHAIFSSPQISGVGKTEEECKEEDIEYNKAKYSYSNTGMGSAMKADGFVKLIAKDNGEILGCHIIGPEASSIIHEVLVAMRTGSGKVSDIKDTIHIHPALNEVVDRCFNQL